MHLTLLFWGPNILWFSHNFLLWFCLLEQLVSIWLLIIWILPFPEERHVLASATNLDIVCDGDKNLLWLFSLSQVGTHSKHLLMKSKNRESVVLIAYRKSLEFGFLFFPLLLVVHRGWPLESKAKEITKKREKVKQLLATIRTNNNNLTQNTLYSDYIRDTYQ